MTDNRKGKKGGPRPGSGRPRKDGLLVGTGRASLRSKDDLEEIRELARVDAIDAEMSGMGWRLDREYYAGYDEEVAAELRKTSGRAAKLFLAWAEGGKRWEETPDADIMRQVAKVRAARFKGDRFAWTQPQDTYPVPHSQPFRNRIIESAEYYHVTFPARQAWARPGFRPGETVPDESRVPGRPDGPPAWMAERERVAGAAAPGTPAGQAPAAGLGAAGPAVGGFVLE